MSSEALIAEATKRAGLIWISAGPGRPHPAWHVWLAAGGQPGGGQSGGGGQPGQPGAAYVLTGPGEQPLPWLADADRVTVTVPSKDTGGLLVSWTAAVSRVAPGGAEWDAVTSLLLAGRLNAVPWRGDAGPSGSGATGVRGVPGEHSPRDGTVSPRASTERGGLGGSSSQSGTAPGDSSPAERWARTCAVYRLAPV
ncbi:MAG: hypothetical protein J2P35_20500 [Actinobacteria bacterium]|nr:hypothetical protein [Actinomycetota bacterium]MBO0785521.1 hypothetical protein [Actinomycetota bacterium]